MKLTKTGTRLILDLLKGINTGQKPESRQQELLKGNMYFVKDYSLKIAYKVNKLVNQGVLNEFCIKPKKKN